MLVCVFFRTICTRDRGCSEHPAFPAPSYFWAYDFSKPRAHRAAGLRRQIQLSSPGLTGRPSIPETPMIKPKSHRVLDTRFRGHDSAVCGGTTTSWQEAKRRSNPLSPRIRKDGLLRYARNDDPSTRNSSQQIAFVQTAAAIDSRLHLLSAL